MSSVLYELFILSCIGGFAVYDIFYQRVPDRALVFFCLVALAAPLIYSYPLLYPDMILLSYGVALAGAATGFFILLTAALLSSDGAGIGGGDIKLAALIGFAYGTYRTLAILVLASGLALIPALCIKKKKPNAAMTLPFVPFLAISTLIVLIINNIFR